MKLKINVFLKILTLLLLLSCTSQSKVSYIDNVQPSNKHYKYSFRQSKPKELLKTGKKDSLFHYHILDTTIEISQCIRNIDKEFQEMKQLWERQISRGMISNTELDSAFFYNSDKFEGQTCYSFAVEMFCRSNAVNPHPYFDSETLISAKTYRLILETLKLDRKAYSWKEFKRVKGLMSTEALIVLKCQGMFTHGIYYKHGLYYSKNGYSQPAIFPNLKSIVKSYKYTDTLLIYTPNKEKLLSVVEHFSN